MNYHLQRPPNASPSPVVFVPEELITDILSFLPVKSLTRLKCVSKSYNTLISNKKFIKLHLSRSSQKADCTFLSGEINHWNGNSVCFTSIHMLENPPNNIITILNYPYHQKDDKDDCFFVVGSCNGLLCLCGSSFVKGNSEWWFRFWNPATHTLSKKLGFFCTFDRQFSPSNFTLGYDKSKDSFKLVHFVPKTTKVRLLSLIDNVWRDIQNSPVVNHNHRKSWKNFVHLSGSVNWLAFGYDDYNCENIVIEQFVIISLDLRTETHTKLLPPQGFNEVPFVVPTLSILKDCLCFSHDFKQTHFVIWQMKLFGVEESWTQLLKVSYHNLRIDYHFNDRLDFHLLPICLSEKNDTLLLANNFKRRAILYNWRDSRIEWINQLGYFNQTDYVESLFPYC